MGTRLYLSAWVCLALVGGATRPAQAYILNSRWTRTATNSSTGSYGTPVTITWSFPADNTTIPGNTAGTTTPNKLLNFLDTNWEVGPGGSDLTLRPWFPIFAQSFARIDALSGVRYVYEPRDDGVNLNTSTSSLGYGVLGVRGDVRLTGRSYEAGSNTLASNYYPTSGGDMIINIDQAGYLHNSFNDYRPFRNTLMHELMHGLGISHVDSSTSGFLIEPILSNAFDGPQLDDLLAIQRLYGDAAEENGGNDVFGNATSLGEISPLQPALRGTALSGTVISSDQVDFLSIDDDSDTDFFRFSISSRLDVSLQLSPQGATYMVGPQDGTQTEFNSRAISDLSLALIGSNGSTILEFANQVGVGADELINRQLLPGTYYARVKGSADNIQLYQLGITASVPTANNLVWVGNLGQNWDVASTANFSSGGAATVFYDLDNATFDDSATSRSVFLPGNVSAGEMHVATAEGYVFSGPGGIVAGSLVVDGSGTVELANASNSYDGSTFVRAGTLAITGDANAMRSAITISAGATLRMNASDAASMTSTFTVEPGGTLQIGTLSSNTNVFPDAPTAITNDGTIRLLTSESVSSIAGAGQIDVENGTTTLTANPAFGGSLTIKSNGVANVADSEGIGNSQTSVVVETGGKLQLAADGFFAQSFQLDDGSTLELGGGNEFQESAKISGNGKIVGDLQMPGAILPGDAESPARLLTADNLTLVNTSSLTFRLGGTAETVDFGTLHILQDAVFAGTLAIDLIDGFTPSFSDTFELISVDGELSGDFSDVLLPELDPSFVWDVVQQEHAVVLQVIAAVTIIPGDFNLDGTVDTSDYTVWRNGLGTKYTPEDYDLWRTHFGEFSGSGSSLAAPQPVPEPAALWQALVTITAVGLALRSIRGGRTNCT